MDTSVSSNGKRRADEPASGDETLEQKRRRLQEMSTETLWRRNQLHGPLRLPQEIQDIIYRYVYSGRTLMVEPKGLPGSYVFTDSDEDSFDGPYHKLPGLPQTCRQLRTTFSLYFELNEVHLNYHWEYDTTVHEWRPTREVLLGFVQAMPETLLSMIRHVRFTETRVIDLLHAITSYRKEVANSGQNDLLRPASILPLASMTGLKQLTIYVSNFDSTADIAPALKALLGAPAEAVVKVEEEDEF